MALSSFLPETLSISSGVCLPFVLLSLAVYYWFRGRDPNRHRYPPGPGLALPLIGNLYQVGMTSPHLTFLKWKKKYGPIIFFKMGSQNTVIVNDAKVMKKLFSNPASAGRPRGPFWDTFSNSFHGIVISGGENGMQQRSFAVKTLTELGLSKSGRLEGIILDEAENLVKYFERKVVSGAPFRATRLFNGGAVSTLWSVVSGEKVDWFNGANGELIEPDVCKLAGQVMAGANKVMKFGLTVMPGLRVLPIFRSVWKGFKAGVDDCNGLVEAKIQAHAQDLDVISPRDFIDYGLIKVGSTTDPSSSFYKEKGRLNLQTSVRDLLVAGSETVSTAIEYLLMYLGSHPQVQEKLAKELEAVIGGRRPNLSDRKMLPYAEAVIMETLRRSATGAAPPHSITHDLEFHGYLLPKDTLILGDVHTILRDPATWEDTDAFRPERFLSEDELEVVTPEDYMPFSTGRRNCIGESLALDTMFLCLASIFLKFRVEVVTDNNDGGTFDLDDVKPGFTLEHEPFDIRVYRRRTASV